MVSDETLSVMLGSREAARLWGDLVRGLIAAVVVALCLGWLAYYQGLGALMLGPLDLNDFGKFFHAARLFMAGQDMYAPNPATSMPVSPGTQHTFLNMNPPHFHLLVLPLAWLAPGWALALWAVANLLSLVVCLSLIAREIGFRYSPARLMWTILLLLVFAGTGAVVITGQLSLLLLLPVTLAWRAMRREDLVRSGVYLGMAVSIKPFLLIFAPYLLLRHREAFGAAALTVVAAFGLGWTIFGGAAYGSWIDTLKAIDWPWATMNASILGVLSRVLDESPYFEAVVSQPGLILPLWVLLATFVALLTIAAATGDRSPHHVDRAFALMLVGSQLVSPLGWIYYLWLPLGPLAGLAWSWRHSPHSSPRSSARLRRCRNALLALALPGLLCPLTVTIMFQPRALATATLGSAYFWGVLFLWGGLMIDWRATVHAPAGDSRS